MKSYRFVGAQNSNRPIVSLEDQKSKIENKNCGKIRLELKEIIQRICQVREKFAGKRGKAFFAKRLGLSPSTYNYYEHNRLAPISVLWKICEIRHTDIQWLLTGRESVEKNTAESENIPPELAGRIGSLLKGNPASRAALRAKYSGKRTITYI